MHIYGISRRCMEVIYLLGPLIQHDQMHEPLHVCWLFIASRGKLLLNCARHVSPVLEIRKSLQDQGQWLSEFAFLMPTLGSNFEKQIQDLRFVGNP